LLLVIVDDLYIVRVAVPPVKAYPPLIVHADAVLSSTVAGESFQTVPWRKTKILQRLRRVQHDQFALSQALHVRM
jgi:hypothetical protein